MRAVLGHISDHSLGIRGLSVPGRRGGCSAGRPRTCSACRLLGGALEEDRVDQPVIERVNTEIKRRTDVVGVFSNPDALLRLAGAVLVEVHDQWAVSDRRYQSEASMASLSRPTEPGTARGVAQPGSTATS